MQENKMTENPSLYARLGGYDAISAVVEDLLPRLASDEQLGRFWANRGDDGIAREKQLLVDYLCASAGGPLLYTGRTNKVSHAGMGISLTDWNIFMSHLDDTLNHFSVPEAEKLAVLEFITSTKDDIVE